MLARATNERSTHKGAVWRDTVFPDPDVFWETHDELGETSTSGPESLYGGVMKGFRRSRERSERTVMAETTKIREEVEKMQRGPLEARSFTLR